MTTLAEIVEVFDRLKELIGQDADVRIAKLTPGGQGAAARHQDLKRLVRERLNETLADINRTQGLVARHAPRLFTGPGDGIEHPGPLAETANEEEV